MTKKILVGLDGSPRAAVVLREALDLAARLDARLTVMRGVSIPIEFPAEAWTVSPDALPARLVKLTQEALDRQLANVPRDRLDRAEARIGTPWQVLCDEAKAMHADLVIVGTHGYGALDRVIGTTAARVVNHAPCSVLVVRAGGTS